MILVKDIFKKASPDKIEDFQYILDNYSDKFKLKTKHQFAMFFAQLLAEIGEQADIKSENFNYSVKGLKNTFKIFRDNPALAEKYGRTKTQKANKEMIANYAYANRIGNGDVSSGDGWKYRGRGLIQLTGKSNYKDVNEFIKKTINEDYNIEEKPELVGINKVAMLSALAFYKMNNIDKCQTVDCATRIVNRYTDSYDKRKKYYNKIISL